MLLQAITIDDRLYEVEKASRSFANTHVFPGGCLPSPARDRRLPGRGDRHAPGLDGGHHRPLPAARWRPGASTSTTAWPQLRELGYDERFRRLWRFYLSFSEGGFAERRIGDVQMLFAKPEWRGEAAAAAGVRPASGAARLRVA